jgi:DNA-binding response OmpR family regulator
MIPGPMKKILLIEDDPNLSAVIQSTLAKEYHITACMTIESSYNTIEKNSFDVVLVDRLLPDGDTLEIIQYLNQTSFSTIIIAMSQLSQAHEKVRGLELGADDYLPKPFTLGELKLKVKKAFQFEKHKQLDVFSTGKLTFYPESGEVMIDIYHGRLRKKESEILRCLFRYKNRVVSREVLIDEVWSHQDTVPTQTTLDVYIRRIRILLRDYGSLIVTKRGFGYSLIDALE